jgi:putative FmdB family regulatory protein
MPTYDYRCEACSHQFEHFQSIKDPSLKKCPKCGKRKLERLIGPGAGILFKGGGFYQTDYRSESYKRGASSESDAAKPGTAKESSKEAGSSTATPSKDVSEAKKAESTSAKAAEKPAEKKPAKKRTD